MNYIRCSFGDEKKYYESHNLAPKWPFRLLICGPSGCGKTNLLTSMIYQMIPYERIYIYAKDFGEDLYVELQNYFEKIHNKIEKKKAGHQIAFFSTEKENIIDKLDPNYQNLIIFDDFVTERDQKEIEDLFIRGRKKNASVIYLSQSYFKTPKNIRLQCNYFIFFNIGNKREMNQIWLDHSTNIDKPTFEKYYQYATMEPYGFLFIDKIKRGFRKRLEEFLN